MRFFITGAAGFIGFHLARRLLDGGHDVFGLDGMTAYYDVALKRRRNSMLLGYQRYRFAQVLLDDKQALDDAVARFAPEIIVHLAAQAGVRHGLTQPDAYVATNIVGTFNLLEAARKHKPRHLLLASTSSVYGGNAAMPFAEADRSDFPLSLYAATKKAGEAMSHAYAHLWNMPTTCFRFFTVYGTWARPDMALFKFVDRIARGEPLDIYGMGQMKREVTAVGDLVEAIVRLAGVVPCVGYPVEGVADSLSPVAPWRSVNIAGGATISVVEMVETIERVMGLCARKVLLPGHHGEASETMADSRLLTALTGFVPKTDFEQLVREFVDWFRTEWVPERPDGAHRMLTVSGSAS